MRNSYSSPVLFHVATYQYGFAFADEVGIDNLHPQRKVNSCNCPGPLSRGEKGRSREKRRYQYPQQIKLMFFYKAESKQRHKSGLM